nr:hypothetical protein [Tanacetum cinerariifolium]
MEAGGKDRPPMLAADKTVPVTEGSSETTTKRYMENYKNVSQDIRDQLNAEAKSVQIILTGIDNDIYSTVDACPNACEMWKAIERLKQGESINVQDLETNLYWEFRKFTSRDGESLLSYYSRFYRMMNELVRNQCNVTNHQVNVQFLLQLQPEWQRFVTLVKQSQELKTVSYHKLYDILKQHQNEVNEIRAKRIARTANTLALVAQQHPVYHPQNHPTHYTQNFSTRSQQAATKNRGKVIVNSPPPIYDQEPTIVAEDDEMSKDKEIDKLTALISLPFKKIYKPTNNNLQTSSNTSRENQDNSLRISRGTGYDNQRIGNVVGARETVEVNSHDTDDSGLIFDSEPLQKVSNNNNYNVFAIECEHPEQSKSVNDTYPIEQDEHNMIIDSLDMSYDREHIDQNDDDDDDDDLANERDLLASLIEKLKCEINDSKKRNKFLDTSNKALVDKLKGEIEDFKNKNKSLESSNNHFKEANNELSKTNELMYKDLKNFQAKLDRRNDVKYASKMEINYPFIQNTIEGNFCPEIQRINADLEKFHLCLKEEMVANLRYFNSLELEVDSLKIQLETQKTQFLNEIDRLSREYYYANHMNAILGVYTELDKVTNLQCDYLETLEKCECLEKELSKSKMMSKSFEALQKHTINLENDLQQCQKKIKSDTYFKENQSKEFRKEREQYFEIQDLKAQLQDKAIAISELKKLIEKLKGKSVDTKFVKSSVIRQPNAFKSQRPSILGKPTIFSDSLEKKDFSKSKNKMPMTVPVSSSEPKCIVNQSVAKPFRRTVVLESTNQKPRHTTRKLYKHVSKACSWCYPKFTPPGYKWKPKSQIGNVNTNLVAIILFIVASGCSKHMTGNLKLLINFVEKVLGTVKFGNDQIAPILGYGVLVQGSRGTDLYSITLQETNSPNPICLMAKATSSQAWLWHRRLSHLNFDTINLLSKNDIVIGLLKLKFVKDNLCSSCELGKAKRKSFKQRLPQAQKDGYNFYIWTYVVPCGSKDETPEVLIDFLRLVQRGLHARVRIVRTDKGTEFLNKTLYAYFASEGINHQTSVARTPEQNGVVKRQIRTIVEVARTMLSAAKVLLFFWAEAIATACFTQNQNAQGENNEFINIFSTPVQDRGETSSCHVDSSNMHIFYQRHPFKHRWRKDHPLEQVIRNPSQSVRTRRLLESDGEMCMFALTVSQTEPKNIKEAMANSAWIESMQEELHQFDRLDV